MHVVTLNLQRDWRGGEHQAFLLARELQELGVAQTVVARRGSPLARRATSLELEVVEAANQFEAFARLPRRSESAPLIYHAHTGNTVPVAIAAAGRRRCSVITRHLDRPVKPWLYRRADRVVAVSGSVREMLSGVGVDPARLRVIPTAIDVERSIDPDAIARLRDRFRIPPGHRVGLTIAAMTPEKDPLTVVRALPSLPSDYVHALVGDGPLLPEAKRLAADLGVADRLLLPGFDPIPEAWFGIADVFVFPSLWEAVGMVALDSFLFGVPVVASDISGTKGLLDHGESCLRFPPGDSERLATAILEIGADEALAARITAEGKRRVQRHDIRPAARSYLELYRELCAAP